MYMDEGGSTSGTDNRKLTFFMQAYKSSAWAAYLRKQARPLKHHCPSGIVVRIREVAWWRFHRCWRETCPHRLQGEANSPSEHHEQQVLRQARRQQQYIRCLNNGHLLRCLPLKLSPHQNFPHRHCPRLQCNHSQRHRPPQDE